MLNCYRVVVDDEDMYVVCTFEQVRMLATCLGGCGMYQSVAVYFGDAQII
jgi:hypothetical protein